MRIRLTAAFSLACALYAFACVAAEEKKPKLDKASFARQFRTHCVQVFVRARIADGKTPSMGSFADDIQSERPTRLGGYWRDDRHVVLEDPGLTDRFIRSIEIGVPGGGERRWPARVAARFQHMQAMLIEVLPDDEGEMPTAHPLSFSRGGLDFDSHVVASYSWDNEWRIGVHGSMGERTWGEDGAETVRIANRGIVHSAEGRALGLAFGDSIRVRGGQDWLWRAAMGAPAIRMERYRELHADLRRRLAAAALEAHFRLRVEIEDDEAPLMWLNSTAGDIGESTPELWSTAFVTGPRRVFIPAKLDARGISRVESVSLRLASGREIPARFVGAARDFMAIIAETDEDLPVDALPPGFALLDPFVVPDEAFMPDSDFDGGGRQGLFLRWRVDYDLGRRRETPDHDRWLGTHRGYGDVPIVTTIANEEEGSLAFDLDGNLIALALAQRIQPIDSPTTGRARTGAPAFRPMRRLYEALHREGAIDPTLAPTAAGDGKRLIGLGIEWQQLDANTSRLFDAEKATRGGKVGLLVIRVYPDTPADEIGLREHDVLLRFFVPGQAEPLELSPMSDHMTAISLLDLEDMSVEATQRIMANLPPPWPSRENMLSTVLTGIGVGRVVRLEYLREGELREAEFVTRYAPPDYKNSPHYKAGALGLTVKPVTYEVRNFFRRDDDSGVIVSKVEVGGRAAVAGLHPYHLILAVDGVEVDGFEGFKRAMAAFENGDAGSVEFLVEGFGKTRLVKIEH
ncbi:MAG: hypothetical protein LBJ46_06895 [Planctomycetota bacterium]|jgi:hypothetical protein|nr:hypothetical protein [Planctomycetota bacterium]